MQKNKIFSINYKILSYFIIFSIALVILLMVSQSLIMKVSYERYQTRKIKDLATTIHDYELSKLYRGLENIAYDNSVCIEYITSTNTISYNNLMVGCGLSEENTQVRSIINDIINRNDEFEHIKLVNKENDSKAILSGIKVLNGYVFLYSPLEDMDGANIVLRNQIVFIAIIVIVIACFVAYFLTNKITRPIMKITDKAKELGEGNYNIKFDQSDVLEIDELAKTLNHVGEDLSKIDELRRDLMANVSHDLKTPLTMIRAYAEMVRDISYKDKEKREKDLNIIIDEVERLNILVNDILDLSKMQADADVLDIEEFDLEQCINEVMRRYEILKTTEDYHFIVNTHKVMIKADKHKIMQVIYNLVNNAINYTGEDKCVYVNLLENKKEYTVEIKDTGKGIKKDEIPHIWDKYYKSDKQHRRNIVSTGIGLSIVREVLKKHKFDYGVKSVMGKGSTFYFKIKK